MLPPISGIYSIKRLGAFFEREVGEILFKVTLILGLLAGGAMYDVRYHKIPNWWILSGVLLGAGLMWWLEAAETKDWWPVIWFFVCCFLVVIVFFPLFYCRMIGAGDIKLMALICGYLGLSYGGIAILYGFLLGAILSLTKLLVQKSLLRRLQYLYAYCKRLILTKEVTPYHNPGRDGYEHTIPMGLCLFLGTLFYTIWIKN